MDGYLPASHIGSAWLMETHTHPWFRFSNAKFLLEDVDSAKSKLSWIPQLLKVPMQQTPAWTSCFQSIPRTWVAEWPSSSACKFSSCQAVKLATQYNRLFWGFLFCIFPWSASGKKWIWNFLRRSANHVSLALVLDHQLPSVTIFSLIFQVLYTQSSVWLSWRSLNYFGGDSVSSLMLS